MTRRAFRLQRTKTVFVGLLYAGLILQGCGKAILSPNDFRTEFASIVTTASTSLSVRVAGELELLCRTPDGNEFSFYLDNAYKEYRLDPTRKRDIIQRYIAGTMGTLTGKKAAVDRARIVPVIKDRAWMKEVRQSLLARGATNVIEQVFDDYNDQLVVLYVEDSPKNIRYLTPEDVEELNIPRDALRQLACDNLHRLQPRIELRGTNGLYMMTVGDGYEASLLLFNGIWTSRQFTVQGDCVVAIPTRDVLLIGGSDDAPAIAKIRRLANNTQRAPTD